MKINWLKVEAQLPDALQTLADSWRAGFSIKQSINYLAQELPKPISLIFQDLDWRLALGVPLSQALTMTTQKYNFSAWLSVAEIIKSAEQSGGNAVPLLLAESRVINDERKSAQEIKTLTAAGRQSGLIIAGLVPAALLLFWFTSPQYLATMFDTPLGRLLLAAALGLEVTGFLWIKQIVRVI